jgi:hypothetical protein
MLILAQMGVRPGVARGVRLCFYPPIPPVPRDGVGGGGTV